MSWASRPHAWRHLMLSITRASGLRLKRPRAWWFLDICAERRVNAFAGTAKTTVARAIIRHYSEDTTAYKKILYAVYNKANQV